MEGSINAYFQNAQLSMAAYAGLTPGISSQAYIDALKDIGFSEALAREFIGLDSSGNRIAGKGYNVIHAYTDPASGFAATLFEDRATGQRILAIRGTEPTDPGDLAADAAIALGQLPTAQITALESYRAFLQSNLDSNGKPYLPSGVPIVVTGHSLGGYLAQHAGTEWQLSSPAIGNVYTYNAPRYPYTGIVPNGLVTNIIASAGPDIIASPDGPGEEQTVFIEAQGLGIPGNHGIGYLVDALAVYNLFAILDSSLNTNPQAGVQKITAILKAASHKDAKSLESALDSLRTLFQENYALGTPDTVATPTTIDNRDSFYANLLSLQDYLKDLSFYDSNTKSLGFTVESLVGQGVSSLLNSAQSDIATRYALYKLNPFAVRNANDLYNAINNNSGALDVYSPTANTGALTEQYLQDRSTFLVNKLWAGTNDKTTASGDALALRNSGKQYFDDRASGYHLYLGEDRFASDVPVSSLTQIVFGGENADQITGGDKWDKLYGMAGADTLQGGKGNDYLEGGQGTDTYTYASGDGLDTLLDTDGLGKITFDGTILNGGKLLFGETYKSTDGKYLYTLLHNAGQQDSLLISGMGGQIVVKDFQSGELGINLDGGTAPAPTSEFHGTNLDDADQIDTGIPADVAGGRVLDAKWMGYAPFGQVVNPYAEGSVGAMYFMSRLGQPYPEGTTFDALYGEGGDDYLLGNPGGRDLLISAMGGQQLLSVQKIRRAMHSIRFPPAPWPLAA